MKFTKKILTMVLALAMIISMNAFSLEFPDVESDNANKEAIDVLSSLGIIKGYEDGQFKPDKEVTRAELTSLLMRLQNLSLTGVEVADTGYTDVATTHWAVYDIKTASSLGIIKGFGDGTFGPEASVTFEQAVKMVVAMLGYENQALVKGGWPTGYIVQGRELGLLKKAEMTQTDPAPRKIIAQILYNALDVDLMSETTTSSPDKPSYEILKGKNVMTEYMKIEKIEGIVSANPFSTLTATESVVMDDEIQIEHSLKTENFKIGTYSNAFDLLGLNVVAYVKYDDNQVHKEIKHIMTKGTIKEVTLSAKDVDTFTRSKVESENDQTGKVSTYKVDSSLMKILYNGKYIDTEYAFNNNLVKPEIGTITLVDSGDGYNLIKIDSYDNYVVKSVDTSEKKIYVDTDLSNGISVIDVPLNDVFSYNISIKKNDADIELSGIKKGNIISVKTNIVGVQNGICNLEILVSDVKKTGKITEASDEETFVISSTSYKVSPSLNGTTIKSQIVYNASGTFYIDVFGDIAYFEQAAAETYNYGYIIKTVTSNNQGDYVGAAKIYDQKSKSFKSLTFADKIELDGERKDHDTIVTELKNIANNSALLNQGTDATNIQDGAQPVKYLVDSSGKITSINTVKVEATNDDQLFKSTEYSDNAIYTSTNRVFSLGGSKKVSIDTKTIVFLVPKNRTEESKYAVKTYSYFVNSGVYDIEVVETTSSGTAATVIVYESNQDEDVHYKSPMLVVEKIESVYEDEEYKTRIRGYVLNTGAEMTYYVENAAYLEGVGKNGVNVEKGDIIRFGLNAEGELNQNVYLYLDASEAAKGNHPDDVNYGKYNDKSSYPVRKVSMKASISKTTSDRYVGSNVDVTGNTFSTYYSFVYGTPLKTITEDTNSIIFTDLTVDENEFAIETAPSVSLIIPDSTAFYVYNAAETDANMLKIVTSSSSADKTSNVLDIKTYDVTTNDCDNVFIYAVEGSVKAVYVIK